MSICGVNYRGDTDALIALPLYQELLGRAFCLFANRAILAHLVHATPLRARYCYELSRGAAQSLVLSHT